MQGYFQRTQDWRRCVNKVVRRAIEILTRRRSLKWRVETLDVIMRRMKENNMSGAVWRGNERKGKSEMKRVNWELEKW